jgi:hypothetical protein
MANLDYIHKIPNEDMAPYNVIYSIGTMEIGDTPAYILSETGDIEEICTNSIQRLKICGIKSSEHLNRRNVICIEISNRRAETIALQYLLKTKI